MHELNELEIDSVSGANGVRATIATTVGVGIAAATFGSTWGAIGVTAAIGLAPIAVFAMAGLALYSGYQIVNKK